MKVKDKHVLVLGGGKSGLSAGKFLLEKGALVDLYDDSSEKKPIYDSLTGANFFLGEMPPLEKDSYNFAVISPGIPLEHPVAKVLAEREIPILGELELASSFITAPIVGITGTNGKTTTTTLLGELLKNAGYHVFVGGNIGTPLLEGVGKDYDYFVVEMSSFQIETISNLNALVSLYLNLTPDHLNRHGDMEGYYKAKAKLAKAQSHNGFSVVNFDDKHFKDLEKEIKAKCIYFSAKEMLYEGACLDGDTICYRYGGNEEKIMERSEIKLLGPHNLENCLGAIAVAKILNIENKVIRKTLMEFKGVEHRMEKVRTLKGVTYINDSKGTNPDSVLKALASYGDTPLILIAGGRNKGSDFDELFGAVKNRVKYTVLMGECAEEMATSARNVGYDAYTVTDTMAEALSAAVKAAKKGDIVLLSPANASFDQFHSFEHRGEVFKELVNGLK